MKLEPKKHATFSASGASRWLKCPGSIQLSDMVPPEPESRFAAEGTVAHEVLETLLKNNVPYTAARALKRKHGDVMVNHAFSAYNKIMELHAEACDAELLCETKVDLTFVGPDMFGTVDAAVVDLYGVLTVIDFKYGAGIPVDPEHNPQLIYYALGLAHKYEYNFRFVRIVIIQPRAPHKRGPYREWFISIDELQKWEAVFRDGVARASGPNPKLASGDHCRFCPAKTLCPEYEPGSRRYTRPADPKISGADDFQDEPDLDFLEKGDDMPRTTKKAPKRKKPAARKTAKKKTKSKKR